MSITIAASTSMWSIITSGNATRQELDVEPVRTDLQLADILTKGLGRVKFVELRQKLGVEEVKVVQHV
jgi:hypothetical protein